MSSRAANVAAPADQPFFGTPTALPRVLLCNSTAERFCGRTWVANTMDEYTEFINLRSVHEVLCAQLMENRGKITESLGRSALKPFPRVTLN